jgi:hypothetical protein
VGDAVEDREDLVSTSVYSSEESVDETEHAQMRSAFDVEQLDEIAVDDLLVDDSPRGDQSVDCLRINDEELPKHLAHLHGIDAVDELIGLESLRIRKVAHLVTLALLVDAAAGLTIARRTALARTALDTIEMLETLLDTVDLQRGCLALRAPSIGEGTDDDKTTA